MKNLMQIMLFVGAVFFNVGIANGDSGKRIKLSGREVSIPPRLDGIKLYKDSNGFHIIKNDEIYDVQNCFCDRILRQMSTEQLRGFLGRNKPKLITITPEELEQINPDDLIEVSEEDKEALLSKLLSGGYISVSQMSDGEYALRANMRLLGGGVWDWLDKESAKIFFISGVGAGIGLVIGGAGGAFLAFVIGAHIIGGACMGAGYGCMAGSGIGFGVGVFAQKDKKCF